MTEFPEIKFEKQIIENIKLPVGSYQIKGINTTMFQPLSSWGESDGFLNMQLNWISAFLWQTYKNINLQNKIAIEELQQVNIQDKNIKEKLRNIQNKLTLQFKELKDMIGEIKNIDDEILKEFQIKSGELINQDKIEIEKIEKLNENIRKNDNKRVITIEERIKKLEAKIDDMYDRLFKVQKPKV